MKKEKFEDLYQQTLQDTKKETMDWDFEEFLAKTKESDQLTSLPNKKSGGFIAPKNFWMAAAFLVFTGLIFFTKNRFDSSRIQENNQLVQHNLEKQKSQYNTITYTQSTVDSSEHKNSESNHTMSSDKKAEEIVSKILPKKFRLKKTTKPRYAGIQNSEKPNVKTLNTNTNSEYQASFVMVNGKKITNEEEAIDVTKKAFKLIASNVNETIEQTKIINQLNVDF